MTRDDIEVILGMTDEYVTQLNILREVLIRRYELRDKEIEYKSMYLLQFIREDPEAFLYCLIYETDIAYDKMKLFPCLFQYPELIRYHRRSN